MHVFLQMTYTKGSLEYEINLVFFYHCYNCFVESLNPFTCHPRVAVMSGSTWCQGPFPTQRFTSSALEGSGGAYYLNGRRKDSRY